MTELQLMRARALKECSIGAGASLSKSFVKTVAYWAEHQPGRELTPRQADFLVKLCWTFRRQLPASLVPAQDPYPPTNEDDTEE